MKWSGPSEVFVLALQVCYEKSFGTETGERN
jgi:hypothetical protein